MFVVVGPFDMLFWFFVVVRQSRTFPLSISPLLRIPSVANPNHPWVSTYSKYYHLQPNPTTVRLSNYQSIRHQFQMSSNRNSSTKRSAKPAGGPSKVARNGSHSHPTTNPSSLGGKAGDSMSIDEIKMNGLELLDPPIKSESDKKSYR